MPEPTLSAAFVDLQSQLGIYLGYGQGNVIATNPGPAWDTNQQAVLDMLTKSGLRKVYHCGYPWSFLKPLYSMPIVNNQKEEQLPDDFGGVEGRMTLSASGTITWWPIEFMGIGQLYQQRNLFPVTTGRPRMAAVEPIKGTTPTQGQRFKLSWWPISDGSYSFQFQYYLNPDYLSGSLPYVYGGSEHSELFLTSCKAAAELDLDDLLNGPQQQEFQRLLEVSERLDRRKKPMTFGYNGDRSDRMNRWGRRPWGWDQHGESLVTVQGVQY